MLVIGMICVGFFLQAHFYLWWFFSDSLISIANIFPSFQDPNCCTFRMERICRSFCFIFVIFCLLLPTFVRVSAQIRPLGILSNNFKQTKMVKKLPILKPCFLIYWRWNFPVTRCVRPSVGLLVGMCVIISSKDGQFHFHAPIWAQVQFDYDKKEKKYLLILFHHLHL